ncbi:MAG: hypothetical protein IJG50_03975, partial [Clostridia bacterium]|nr:hypothetical protein [Clostridia bacterium]
MGIIERSSNETPCLAGAYAKEYGLPRRAIALLAMTYGESAPTGSGLYLISSLFNATRNQRAPKTWSGSAAEHQWGRKLIECALMAKR